MTDAPNPVRTFESHGVAENFEVCPDSNHHMVSIKTGATLVRFVERCTVCGWIDAASLDWWAEDAIKQSLSARAARMAVAAEALPFSFVQSSGEDLTLEEVLFQALGAASMCWVGGTGGLEFDSVRAKEIGVALVGEVNRALHMAQHKGRQEAVR